jgi:hypothetical protein
MEIEGVPEHLIPILITRQFLGELEVRQILPPSYRFPPRAGETKQRFPLRSRGNLTEGGLQKVSCNEIPSRVHF